MKEKVVNFDQGPLFIDPLLGTVGIYTVAIVTKLYAPEFSQLIPFYKMHSLEFSL